jgi:hypothetical protein
MAGRCSIVLEYENASSHGEEIASSVFRALQRQFLGRPVPAAEERDELIVAFDSSRQSVDDVDQELKDAAPEIRKYVDCHKLALPSLRYYELKNAGAAAATREILVFLDSDVIPEDGWLDTLLAPFADSKTVAVNGHTYLGHHGFVSRVFALMWVFPLRQDRPREVMRRSLNANNCAFRQNWFTTHCFPEHPGFKVSCSLLAVRMREEGVDLERVPAFARHEPLAGWRFLLWRAVVGGRDDDSRYATLRSARKDKRVVRAGTRWIKQNLRSARRIALQHRSVGMPVYEVPLALLLAWAYYSVSFVSQLSAALSGPRQEPERIPDFVTRQ